MKGFTLIELMIVVVIIGILAIPLVSDYQQLSCESQGYTWEDGKCFNYKGE